MICCIFSDRYQILSEQNKTGQFKHRNIHFPVYEPACFLFFTLLPYNFRKLAIFTCNISEIFSSVRKLTFGAVFDSVFRKAEITAAFISQCI